mgnify:CR=1 FL=1
MYRDQFESLNRGRLNWQTEEEVRLGWLTELQNKLAITFHAEQGRTWGYFIIAKRAQSF